MEDKNIGLQQAPYYVPAEQIYQEDVQATQLQREYEENIKRIKNKVEIGVNIAREIKRIIGGLIFSAGGEFMISKIMNPNMTMTGMPWEFVALFWGLFVVLGLFQAVKGIRALIIKR